MPPWIIGVALPEEDMMGRIYAMNKRQAELFLRYCHYFVARNLFARRVTRAIQDVTEDMERIANFNFRCG